MIKNSVFNKEDYETNPVRGLMKRKMEHTKERIKHEKRHIPSKGVEGGLPLEEREEGRSESNGRGTAANHRHRCEAPLQEERQKHQRRRELTTAEGSKRVDLPQVVHRPRNGGRGPIRNKWREARS